MYRNKLKYRQLSKFYTKSEIDGFMKSMARPKSIVGQKRALKALKFGLENKAQGFNVYVSGESGTGKMTALTEYLTKIASKQDPPKDWCYINHFDDPYSPKYINLHRGQGLTLKKEIKKFLWDARVELSKTFSSKEYVSKKEKIEHEIFAKEVQLLQPITEKAKKQGFIIQQVGMVMNAFPKKDDHPMTDEEYLELDKKEQNRILKLRDEFKNDLMQLVQEMEKLHNSLREQKERLEQNVALEGLKTYLNPLRTKYESESDVLHLLDNIQEDLLENLNDYLKLSTNLTPLKQTMMLEKEGMIPRRYEVNVIVNNGHLNESPVIIEQNPTYNNLFGKIEKESENGRLSTNFTLIRSGALHKANGGYLILPIEGLLKNYFSWDALKRALKNKEIRIEEPGEQLGFLSTRGLQPDPIPLDLQVILIGKPIYFNILFRYDDEFTDLFKVKAHFDTAMIASAENVIDFKNFLQNYCAENSLLPLSKQGFSRLLTYSHREAGDQKRISTRFRKILDILQEANHYASITTKKQINAEHIEKSINEKEYRSESIKERVQELIQRKTILIDLEGKKIGQLNAISVSSTGDITFGRPNRITASVSLGKSEIIDIEREVNLGGPIHSKGVLILKGYLTEIFGQDKILNLSAQLVFEQSYGEIEGDSASSAELYTILSGLARVPLKQCIAVTGSVNQKGMIQPVGAINEKVEGFFEVCQQHGLTGNQGVIIPASNKQNLLLEKHVIEAVKNQQFHIWAIDTIEEGIEILTEMPTGVITKNRDNGISEFEKGSLFDLINERFIGFNKILQKQSQPPVEMVDFATLEKYLDANVIPEEDSDTSKSS